MRKNRFGLRILAFSLAWLLTVQPLLAATSLATAYQKYARGEISLSEYEDAKRKQLENERKRTRVSAPAASNVTASVESEEGEKSPGKVKKIAKWVVDIPKRFLNRRTKSAEYFKDFDEIQKYEDEAPVKPYSGNAAMREADATIWRPIKVTALNEINQMQGVVEKLIAFNAVSVLTKANAGNATAKSLIESGKKVLSKLTPAQKAAFAQNFAKGNIGNIARKAATGSKGLLKKLTLDKSGNNMLLIGVAASVVGIFLNDGLDLDTLKDHIVSLNLVQNQRSLSEYMIGNPVTAITYYHANNKATLLFNSIYDKARQTGMLGKAIKGAERSVGALGSKLLKKPPSHLAGKAKAFGDTAKGLGLPGISAAEQLSFKALSENAFKGLGLGVAMKLALDLCWDVTVGIEDGVYVHGRRDKNFVRFHDLPYNYFQKSGNKFKDMIEERRIALQTRADTYTKWPITQFLNGFAMFMGGYLGAVLASSLLPVTGIASFGLTLLLSAIVAQGGMAFGTWLGAKLDTSSGFFGKQRKKNAKKLKKVAANADLAPKESGRAVNELRKLDELRRQAGLRNKRDYKRLKNSGGAQWQALVNQSKAYLAARDNYENKVADLVLKRSLEIEKLTRASQANRNILFVRHLSDVQLIKEGGYIKILITDDTGVPFKKNATPRYDIIDTRGHRGVWDSKTNRIIDCGPLSETNGLRIFFADDEDVDVSKKGELIPKKGGKLGITTAGIVYEQLDGSKDWNLKGYGAEYDIVLRTSGQRFRWDGTTYVTYDASRPKSSQNKDDKAAQKVAKREAKRKKQIAKLRKKLFGRSKVKDPVLAAMKDLSRLAKANGISTNERLAAVVFK